MERYKKIYETRTPVLRRANIEHIERKQFLTYEALHVPFLDSEGQKVSQIMAVYQFNSML